MKKLIKKATTLCFLYTLSLMICFFIFSLSACQKDKTLDLNNYTEYIDVNAGTTNMSGAGTLRMYTGYVIIKKKSAVYSVHLQNVKIKYTVTAENFNETVSESLLALNTDYSKRIEFNITYTSDDIFYRPPVSVAVLEISGEIIAAKQNNDYIILIIMGVAVLITLAIAIPYYTRLKRMVKSIVSGMSYSEVINILGEPDESASADEITTSTWQHHFRRGGPRTYCTVTFKNDKVVSVIHKWQDDFFEE